MSDAANKSKRPLTRENQLGVQLNSLKAEEQVLKKMLMHLMNRKRQLLIEGERLKNMEENQQNNV